MTDINRTSEFKMDWSNRSTFNPVDISAHISVLVGPAWGESSNQSAVKRLENAAGPHRQKSILTHFSNGTNWCQEQTLWLTFLSLWLLLVCPKSYAAILVVNPEGGSDSTITRALESAGDGDTILIKEGTYRERLKIEKSLTLIGEGNPIVDGGGVGNVIELMAAKTTIRGLTIRNSGNLLAKGSAGVMIQKAADATIETNLFQDVLFGIQVRHSPNSIIRDNTFHGKDLDLPRRGDLIRVWYSDGTLVEKNNVFNGRDIVIWYSDDITVLSNEIHNGRYGLHFMYCDNTRVEDNHLVGNSVGAYLMYSYRFQIYRNWFVDNHGASGYGIGQKDMYQVEIAQNFVAGNRTGFFLDNTTGEFRGNLIAFNDCGVLLLPSSVSNQFESNSFVDNRQQVSIAGGQNRQTGSRNDALRQQSVSRSTATANSAESAHTVETATDTQWRNNYWSDYNGYDGNNDGFGDFSYKSMYLFEQLIDRHPELRLFTYSPSVQLLDFAGRLFPIFAPHPKLVDPAPRMKPLIPPLKVPSQQVSVGWVIASLSLIGCALFISLALPRIHRWNIPILVSSLLPYRFQSQMFGDTAVYSFLPADTYPHPNLQLAQPGIHSSGEDRPLSSTSDNSNSIGGTMISINHLTKRFGSTAALNDLSCDILAGETIAFWGENGAGKTTALRCLLGIYSFEGEIAVCGQFVSRQAKSVRHQIGYVPQEIRLHRNLTVRQTLLFYAGFRSVSDSRIQYLINEWNLADIIDKPVRNLSGGMRQRLSVAIALLSDPPILLLDEPTSNLDVQTRGEFWTLLVKLKQSGKTLIFSSHRIEEVLRFADRVIVLKNGEKVAEGDPANLASYLPLSSTLELIVPETSCKEAEELLLASGFLVSDNGREALAQSVQSLSSHTHGLLVDTGTNRLQRISVKVTFDRKAEPIKVLTQASIEIIDFELTQHS